MDFAMASSFAYEPLDQSRRSFRLLRLLRHDYDVHDFPRCELFGAFFDCDEDLIPYEALSYTWGGPMKNETILLDGKKFNVTMNLHQALLDLQSRDTDRILWVDAVCIDQSSDSERTHQVQQMSQVYQRAERVVVWLGALGESATDLMCALKTIEATTSAMSCTRWEEDDDRWNVLWARSSPWGGLAKNDLTRNSQQAAGELFGHPWFSRVWILQEIAFSHRAVILGGGQEVPSHIFVLLPHLLNHQLLPHDQSVLDLFPRKSKRDSWWRADRKPDLFTLLMKFDLCCASDPRDLIFALLGMCSDTNGRL